MYTLSIYINTHEYMDPYGLGPPNPEPFGKSLVGGSGLQVRGLKRASVEGLGLTVYNVQ